MKKPWIDVWGLWPRIPAGWWIIIIALSLMAAVWWYFDSQIAAIH